MNQPDLLIVDIGRSFLFSTELNFDKHKGLTPGIKRFSRYPKFEDINIVIDKFINGFDYANCYFLSENTNHYHNIKGNCSQKDTVIWTKNISELGSLLEIEGLSVLDIGRNTITKSNKVGTVEKELDFLDLEIFRDNLKMLGDVGISVNDLLNYFLSDPPIPQQVSDYQKSFLISYIIGIVMASSFNFKNDKYLIVLSEWFKCGFLDMSGFIYGFGKISGIKRYSFDSNAIWKLLITEGSDEFKSFQLTNKKAFTPEFLILDTDLKNIKYANSMGKIVNENINKYSQGYLQDYANGSLSPQIDNIGGDIFLNIKDLAIREMKNIDNFKRWYMFYRHDKIKYVPHTFNDSFNHIVEVDTNTENELNVYKGVNSHGHDISQIDKLKYSDISVVVGQVVKKDQVLVEKSFVAGVLYARVRSSVNGIVDNIDFEHKQLSIKTADEDIHLKNFDYDIIDYIARNKVRIHVTGRRLDIIYMTQKGISFGFLVQYSNRCTFDTNSILWFWDVDCLRKFLVSCDNGFLPTGIILPSIEYVEFMKIANMYKNIFNNMQVIFLNGFGNRSYTKDQIHIFSVNKGKSVVIDPVENSLYILEKKMRFGMSQAPVIFRAYSRVFTFDDWNLVGEVIYNESDSNIFRSDNSSILDIAEYNIIDFNNTKYG